MQYTYNVIFYVLFLVVNYYNTVKHNLFPKGIGGEIENSMGGGFMSI